MIFSLFVKRVFIFRFDSIQLGKGKFQTAHQGTLLLDENGDMSFLVQAKVLRVLEQGEVQQIGVDNVARVDVRVIATTKLKRNIKELELRFEAKINEVKMNPIKWVIGIATAQAMFIIALLKLL